jgi:3',5'-cyclic AMP phosphodiesterase CpdA
MKFIHLSDLHIHTDSNNNIDVTSTLNFILKNYPNHALIVTGDITDDGAEDQYVNAYNLLKPFQSRIFICPGNHDFGAVGNLYSHERALRFDAFLAKQLALGGTFKGDSTPVVNVVREQDIEIMLIALDSNLETYQPFDFACGEIGQVQLKALENILTSSRRSGVIKILFFHHHPFMVNDPFMELKDAKELARVVYGKVDVILFGHKHEMGQWNNRWGIKHILASDNSPNKNFAKEIEITNAGITISNLPIA